MKKKKSKLNKDLLKKISSRRYKTKRGDLVEKSPEICDYSEDLTKTSNRTDVMNLPTHKLTIHCTITVDSKEWIKWFEHGAGRKPADRDEFYQNLDESLLPQIMGVIVQGQIPVESLQLSGADKPIITKDEAK
jgi:hypothetical protein